MGKIELVTLDDIDFGYSFCYPKGYEIRIYPEMNIWSALSPDKKVCVLSIVYMDKKELAKENVLIDEAVYQLFGDTVKKIEKKKENSSIHITIHAKKRKYQGVLIHKIFSYRIEDINKTVQWHVRSGVIYDASIVGTPREKNVAQLIVQLAIRGKKYPADCGCDVLFKYVSNMGGEYDFRWSLLVPQTWTGYGLKDSYSHIGKHILVKIYPEEVYFRDMKTLVDMAMRNHVLSLSFENDPFINASFRVEKDRGFGSAISASGKYMLYAEFRLYSFKDSAGTQRHFLLHMISRFPSRVRSRFLPLINEVFSTWKPAANWLKEQLQVYKPTPVRVRTLSTTRKQQKSDFIKRFREESEKRRKAVIKRFYEQLRRGDEFVKDYEYNLWRSTYETIKTSDVITGMYTLESPRGKTKLVTTRNIVSPFTHNLWKPKNDVLWQTTWATPKGTRPPYIVGGWEKLEWHWDKELERLDREYGRKRW